jgi:glycosyltransferase involved in cell wall biosynthesis
MNVCLWTDSDCFAGTEKHCLELASGLREAGVGVILGCRSGTPLYERALAEGLEVETLAPSRFPLQCVGKVQRMLNTGRVDVVHTHNGVTTAWAAVARRGGRRGGLVATQHFIHPARTRRRGFPRAMLGRIQKWNERSVSRWVAISGAVQQAMLDRGDAEAARVSVIPNGMQEPLPGELEREAARRALGVPREEMVLVCPARLEEEKDHRTLLHACALLKAEGVDFRTYCLGEGVLRAALETRVRELNLAERVLLPGYQSRMESWIRAADVVVLPSPEEPFGLVLLEAMSRGVPVVAAAAGGPWEILEAGAGLLFSPRDPRDLAGKLSVLCRDGAERVRLGQAGLVRWKQGYTRQKMVTGIIGIYRSALGDTENAG